MKRILYILLISFSFLCAREGAYAQSETTETVVVGTTGRFPPYSMLDEYGQPYGFSIDIMEAVAKRANIQVAYVVTPKGGNFMNYLKVGTVDVIASLGISEKRKESFAFTPTIETARVSFFTRQDSVGMSGLEDFYGKRVAVVPPNLTSRILKKHPQINQVVYKDVPDAFFALLSAQVDAFAYTESVAWDMARKAGIAERLKVAATPIREIKRAMAVRKNDAELLAVLSPAVEDFLKSEEYREIYVKWFGEKPSFWTAMRVAVVMGAIFGIVIVALMGWRYVLLVSLNKELLDHMAQRKKAEEQKEAALVEAERANQAKSEFLATMSHEFRTPLNAILGFSEMLRAQYFGPLGADNYQEYAEDIHTSGKHMLALVNDMLDIAAIEAGKRSMVNEDVDIVEILTESLKNVEPLATKKNLELKLDAPENLPNLFTDHRSMTQIAINLLSNAVKFTEPGGNVTAKAWATGDSLVMEFIDTGIGIPAEKLASVTDPFNQTHTDPHLAQEGSGLGLSIVKSLARAHKGKLEIASEMGKGTTARVTFPL